MPDFPFILPVIDLEPINMPPLSLRPWRFHYCIIHFSAPLAAIPPFHALLPSGEYAALINLFLTALYLYAVMNASYVYFIVNASIRDWCVAYHDRVRINGVRMCQTAYIKMCSVKV